MYKSFYNLQRNPFEITPDPSFLFPTTRHNEALASLYYGVTAHRGFVVLTGEVGTGKTLILRSLLGLLQRREVAFALIFNPTLTPLEFMRYIALDFGLQVTGKAKDELIHLLNGFLLQRYQKGLTTILVVDEAHHLSSELLEEIRLLSNLETSQQKLLQIVLAGQPELDMKLDSHELRQLKQRISLRCHLDPLTALETREYMNRRLDRIDHRSRFGRRLFLARKRRNRRQQGQTQQNCHTEPHPAMACSCSRFQVRFHFRHDSHPSKLISVSDLCGSCRKMPHC